MILELIQVIHPCAEIPHEHIVGKFIEHVSVDVSRKRRWPQDDRLRLVLADGVFNSLSGRPAGDFR